MRVDWKAVAEDAAIMAAVVGLLRFTRTGSIWTWLIIASAAFVIRTALHNVHRRR